MKLGIATKAGDLDFEPFLLENLGLDSHFGRAEGERVGNRLAKTDFVEPERRAGGPQRKRCKKAYQRAPPQRVMHCLSLLLGFIGDGRPPGIGMAVHRHRFFAQPVEIFDHLSVAHVF